MQRAAGPNYPQISSSTWYTKWHVEYGVSAATSPTTQLRTGDTYVHLHTARVSYLKGDDERNSGVEASIVLAEGVLVRGSR